MTYKEACEVACKWGAEGLPLSGGPGLHWTGNPHPPACTAPTPEQWMEQQAARISELEPALDTMHDEYRALGDLYYPALKEIDRLLDGQKLDADTIGQLQAQRDRQAALIKELLGVLQETYDVLGDSEWAGRKRAKAAIAKAERAVTPGPRRATETTEVL